MQSEISTPLWGEHHTRIWLSIGRWEGAASAAHEAFREGSLVLQRRPLNAVDNALLCMLVCSNGRKPVRGKLPVGKRRHAGDHGPAQLDISCCVSC